VKFSVIIPTFNRAEKVIRAIESVLSQTFKDYELIVIDDGSTDDTYDLIKGFPIQYHKIENSGVSAARNFGVKLSQGEWLAFLDSDDEWLPNKLELQARFIKENDYKVVHGEEIWMRRGKRVNPKLKHKKSGGDIFEASLELCLMSPSTIAIKRELFESYGGFREDFEVCEDYDLWLKITRTNEVGFIEQPIIIKHGGHEDQLSTKHKAMDLWRVKSMQQLLKSDSKRNRENWKKRLKGN
jgi:glycosyltransferase involved in cell wall biosynthesis